MCNWNIPSSCTLLRAIWMKLSTVSSSSSSSALSASIRFTQMGPKSVREGIKIDQGNRVGWAPDAAIWGLPLNWVRTVYIANKWETMSPKEPLAIFFNQNFLQLSFNIPWLVIPPNTTLSTLLVVKRGRMRSRPPELLLSFIAGGGSSTSTPLHYLWMSEGVG